MEKIKIGIPRPLLSYDEGKFLYYFLEKLDYEIIVSDYTNKSFLVNTNNICTSMNCYIKHIENLLNQCDFVLNIKFNNKGLAERGCSNYLLINNYINSNKMIDITIDHYNYHTIYRELLRIFNAEYIDKRLIKAAYLYARVKISKEHKNDVIDNTNRLLSSNKKVLIIGEPYNIYDDFYTKEIYETLKSNKIDIVYYDMFDKEKIKYLNRRYIKNIYIQYIKQVIGSFIFCENKIDGIIIFSDSKCPLDDVVIKELIEKIDYPFLKIVINSSFDVEESLKKLNAYIKVI